MAYDILGESDKDVLNIALRKCIAECKTDFGPTIAHLRQAALSVRDHANGEADHTPEQIWAFASSWCLANAQGVAQWHPGIEVPALYRRVLDAFQYDRWAQRETENYGVDFAQFRDIAKNITAQERYKRDMLPAERTRMAAIVGPIADKLRLPAAKAAPAEFGRPKTLIEQNESARNAMREKTQARIRERLSNPLLTDAQRKAYERILEAKA